MLSETRGMLHPPRHIHDIHQGKEWGEKISPSKVPVHVAIPSRGTENLTSVAATTLPYSVWAIYFYTKIDKVPIIAS